MIPAGRQVAVSGLGNILRYLARERKYTSLYNEEDLESAALIDEILSLTDLLEVSCAIFRNFTLIHSYISSHKSKK